MENKIDVEFLTLVAAPILGSLVGANTNENNKEISSAKEMIALSIMLAEKLIAETHKKSINFAVLCAVCY